MATARSAAALIVSRDEEARDVVAWYRHLLASTEPPRALPFAPVSIGPTWQWGPEGWVLPELTLGWGVLAWTGVWLRGKARGPWQYTPEQTRFILHYYAVDEAGVPLHHSAALQRMKGWGKDPIAATVSAASAFGPVTFDHWGPDGPVGREELDAWVQIVAVAQEQTQNTMKLFPGLISPEARAYYGIQIGKRNVWGMGDTRQIQAVTSSPLALEGGRPTQIIRNETQNWLSANSGHDMAGVMEGNAAKRDIGSPARILDIFNAHRAGEDSVAERVREAWESTQGDIDAADEADRPSFAEFGLMYDSLEAPPDAPMTATAIGDVVEGVRGDAIWVDLDRVKKSVLNPMNAPSESRRKWYNQSAAPEDSWTTPQVWDPLGRPDAKVERGEEVALFLDCSKSDDATALVGCRIVDGHVFTLGMWQRPPGERGRNWLVPRGKVDAAVTTAFETYKVVAFFGDPSHTLDDETLTRFWDTLFDGWHRKYKTVLKVWAHPGKDAGNAVMFDMALPENQKKFTEAVAVTEAEMDAKALSHDGDPRLRHHVLNARRHPTRYGMSIAKNARESSKKIDLAVCMVGARMARRIYLNTRTKKGGRVW